MRKKTLWWVIGSLVVLVVILIAFGKSQSDTGIKVAAEATGRHTITQTVTASGKIYPETEVKISPEVSGEIIELTIAEGDSVRKGQLLVKINPAIYSSMVAQQSATVQQSRSSVQNAAEMMAQARSQFELAQATYNRNRKLYAEKVISAMEMEQAEASYKGAQAAYEAARASTSGGRYGIQAAEAGLSQARENLRKTTIFAPSSGIISQLNVKLGERVVGTAQMAGTEMLTIADMSRMEVRVDVSETDIAKVKLGDTCLIEADAYRNRRFTGLVSKIGVSSNKAGAQLTTDQVTNYTVHILILPGSYADLQGRVAAGKFIFKPGMSASTEIQTRREHQVLSVPVNAVTTRDWPDSLRKQHQSGSDIRQVVFVLNSKDQTVSLRDVQTGIQDNEFIQITGGLKEGEQVVVAPYGAIARELKQGSKVRVVKRDQIFESRKTEEEE